MVDPLVENFAPTLQFAISLAQLCETWTNELWHRSWIESGNGDKQPDENQVVMGLSDQLAINLLVRDGLYEISIRLNRSMWRGRRRLDVTVPNSGKLEIYLSNLPAPRFSSSSATLVPRQFFIIRKWVVTLMRQILNVVQDVGGPSRALLLR